MKPHILYIAADYTGVHQSLHQSLTQLGECNFTIYIPLNYRWRARKYPDYLSDGSRVFSSSVIGKWDFLLYRNKIKKLVNYIVAQDIDWQHIDLIHATTWCLEGAVAYELSKRFSIPYIIAVRSTDVNTYYKYLFYHRRYFQRILLSSQYVAFLNRLYLKKVLGLFPEKVNKVLLSAKCDTIFNGVNPFFLLNRNKKQNSPDIFRVIYVGAICHRKNLLNVIQAIQLLHKKGLQNVTYTVVGKGKKGEEANYLLKVEKEARRNNWITVLPEQSKEQIVELYKQSDIFVMCSFHETFGLVYAEALSQGLPVLYSKGEGFDGIFAEGEVGYHARASSVIDIADKLQLMINNYNTLINHVATLPMDQFDWKNVAEKYVALYKKYGKRS